MLNNLSGPAFVKQASKELGESFLRENFASSFQSQQVDGILGLSNAFGGFFQKKIPVVKAINFEVDTIVCGKNNLLGHVVDFVFTTFFYASWFQDISVRVLDCIRALAVEKSCRE